MDKPKTAKKFQMAYAYSVGAYAQFTIEAESERQAKRIATKALREGRFTNVECEVSWDSIDNHRVLSMGEDTIGSVFSGPTMEQLIKEGDEQNEH